MLKITRYIIPLFILSFLISCKSFDRSLITNKAYIDPGVPPMRVVVNKSSINYCFVEHRRVLDYSDPYIILDCSDSDRSDISDVIKNNLTFPGEPGDNYLSVIVRRVEGDYNGAWFCLFLPNLGLVFPFATKTLSVELDAAVMSSDGHILKRFHSTGNDWERAGGIGGYDIGGRDIRKATYTKAIIDACENLRNQLKKDAIDNNLMKQVK